MMKRGCERERKERELKGETDEVGRLHKEERVGVLDSAVGKLAGGKKEKGFSSKKM